MSIHRINKYLSEPLAIVLSHLIVQEPLRTRSHGRVEKTQHRNDASHDIIHSKILNAQYIQYHTACIQSNSHSEEHAEIQEEGILGYTVTI